MDKLPLPEKIHRIIFGFDANDQQFIGIVHHGEVKEFLPLTTDTLKWVNELKRLHGVPVYGQNNRLPLEYKQLWDGWEKNQESVE